MNPLNNLKQEAQQIRLSEGEKARMHAAIFGLPAQAGAPSPVTLHKSPYLTVSHYSWFSARFVTAMAAFLVVVLGSGTVYAAQGALPGDTLYTVKVSVTEPVRAALAFSSEAKLSVHTELAEERLEEAQALAAEGRLSKQAAAEIETNLETHVNEAEVLAQKLEEEDPDTAAEVAATLDAALSVNSAILATLGDESDDDDTKENSHSLASRAQARVAYARNAAVATGMGSGFETMSLMAPGAEAEDPNALMATDVSEDISAKAKFAPALATATEAQIKASAQMEKRAEGAVSDAQSLFDKTQRSLGTTTTARVRLELEAQTNNLKTGDELETEGNYVAAKDLYLQIYKDAQALSTFIRAEQKFNKKILNSLLNERFGFRELQIQGEVRGDMDLHVENEHSSSSAHDDSKEDDNEDDRNRDEREEDGDDPDEKKDSKDSLNLDLDLDL